MANQKVSRKDVADLAGVSETIVSYVLNHNRYVKKEKKEAVLEAVKKLNYKPNRFARALKGKTTKHIMLLVDRIRTEAIGELITEIDNYSENLGYMISVSIIEDTDEYVNKIIDWQVDAVIILTIHFSSERIQNLINSGIVTILMENRDYSHINGAVLVNTGLKQGAQMSVDCLYSRGSNKVAFADRISITDHFSDKKDYRLSGYLEGVKKYNQEPIVFTGCHNSVELETAITEQFKIGGFDGIFCRNDEVAFVVMNILLRHGYKVPEEVSVIGVDNTSFSKASYPSLTTIKIDRASVARLSIEAIENKLNGKAVQNSLILPELIIRESVRKF